HEAAKYYLHSFPQSHLQQSLQWLLDWFFLEPVRLHMIYTDKLLKKVKHLIENRCSSTLCITCCVCFLHFICFICTIHECCFPCITSILYSRKRKSAGDSLYCLLEAF